VLGADGGTDAARHPVRGRPRASGAGRVGLPQRGHHRLRRTRHGPGDRRRRMSRPRTSTVVLSALFVAVFALYLLVRPPTPSTETSAPGTDSQSTPSDTASPSPTQTPRHTSPSPSPSTPTPSPSPTSARSGRPSPSPSASPA